MHVKDCYKMVRRINSTLLKQGSIKSIYIVKRESEYKERIGVVVVDNVDLTDALEWGEVDKVARFTDWKHCKAFLEGLVFKSETIGL